MIISLTARVRGSGRLEHQSGNDAATLAGEKTTWHDGFDRYDFVMDEASLSITPFTRPASEKYGVEAAGRKASGGASWWCRRCAAAGNPWSWQGCYWDHEPQAEVELLRRGFTSPSSRPTPARSGMPGTRS